MKWAVIILHKHVDCSCCIFLRDLTAASIVIFLDRNEGGGQRRWTESMSITRALFARGLFSSISSVLHFLFHRYRSQNNLEWRRVKYQFEQNRESFSFLLEKFSSGWFFGSFVERNLRFSLNANILFQKHLGCLVVIKGRQVRWVNQLYTCTCFSS